MARFQEHKISKYKLIYSHLYLGLSFFYNTFNLKSKKEISLVD